MLQVYCPNITNRKAYAFKLVLKQVCLLEFQLVEDRESLNTDQPIINYSGELIENALQVHPHGLLDEYTTGKFDVSFEYGGEEKVKLFLTEFDELGFDIFSASFFLATRFEEYWQHEKDEHGRFTSKSSLATKLGFLKLPLINIWGKVLQDKLKEKYHINVPERSFEIFLTVDIDNAWAYKNKGFIRAGGAMGKSITKGNFSEVTTRTRVLSGKEQDPYDTYDYLENIQKDKELKSIYFFLLGDRGSFDKNVSHAHPQMINLIKQISEYAEIGIHPSYASFLKKEKIKKEAGRLETILNEKVILSRKHFLRLQIPETYRNLEEVGITNDFTMGYADNVGFRASICTPYTFFDLEQNRELNLTIHPFAYMDGTLNEYLKLSISEALELVEQLKENVKQVGGDFIGIWHNETLNDQGIWKGWKAVFEKAISLK